MKKEGTGDPRNPDISLDANVETDEMYFKKVSETRVYFLGNSRRNSVWESSREDLPNEVREGVVYRNAGVRLRIASEIADSGLGSWSGFGGERVGTNLRPPERKTEERKTEERKIESGREKE